MTKLSDLLALFCDHSDYACENGRNVALDIFLGTANEWGDLGDAENYVGYWITHCDMDYDSLEDDDFDQGIDGIQYYGTYQCPYSYELADAMRGDEYYEGHVYRFWAISPHRLIVLLWENDEEAEAYDTERGKPCENKSEDPS